jgi:type II secretory pathway pseudopilin PulG
MAVLLVAMSIMMIMMTVAMPVWHQASVREKEEELVFRGEQYARAIGLFKRKFGNANPPNLDVLVEQRFLRRKYKDPIANSDFVPLTQNQPTPGSGQPSAGGRGGSTSRPAGSTNPAAPGTATPGRGTSPFGTSPIGTPGAGAAGGIIGVTSKSKAPSIRLYKGRNHYNEWAFVYTQPTQAPGVGAPGATAPGGRGQPQRGGANSPFTSPFGSGGGRGGQPQRGGQPPGGRTGPGGTNPMFPQPPTTPRGRGPGNP